MTPAQPGGSLFGGSLFGGAVTPVAPPGAQPFSQIAYRAFRIAGVLRRPGRGASGNDLSDAMQAYNSMVDGWKAEKLMVYAILRNILPLLANKQFYSIGLAPGADIALPRPQRIDNAGFIFNNVTPAVEIPFQMLTQQEWDALSPKELQSTNAYMMLYQATVPNGTITVWPIPNTAWQMALYLWQQVQQITTTSTVLIIPNGYQEFFEYSLAVEIWQEFESQSQLSPDRVQNMFRKMAIAKERIQIINATNDPLKMQTEAACNSVTDSKGHYSILTNTYIR